jgi:hypothetical protein
MRGREFVRNRLKIDARTDRLTKECAHFLGLTESQYVAEAVAHYAAFRRSDIEKGIKDSLAILDRGREDVLLFLAGISEDEIADLHDHGSS